MGLGSAIGGIVSGALGLFGSDKQNQYNMAMSQADRDFQREVYQNQLQWKAADAKKAGLHPLAALGGGAYSASPSSIPSVDLSSSLGKLGEGIGDAFTAYMTKDQVAAAAAKAEERADQQHDASMRESAARTLMYNGQALEATRRAATYNIPFNTGREIINGQTQADAPRKFERYRNPDGSLSGRLPTEPYQGIYDDKPVLEYKPGIEALYWDARDWLADKFGVWDFRGTRGSY